jgi:hypothetical protein
MKINIGEIGERILTVWCAENGMVVNKADEDKKGWDYIIQFENNIKTEKMLDKKLDEISLFVQVKTTTKKGNNRSIKLSNWNNAIRNPLPSFILYIVLQSKSIIKDVYFIHINEKYIEKILQILRGLNDPDINHKKLQFELKQDDMIYENYGENIKMRIKNIVADGIASYSTKKINFVKTIGYTDIYAKGNISFKGDITDIVDFAIGVKKTIDISKFRIETGIRFEIPEEIEEFDNGILEIDYPGRDIVLRFTNDKGIISTIEAKVHSPHFLIPNIPIEKTKVRISSLIGDLIFTFPNRLTGKFSFDLDDQSIDSKQQLQIAKIIILFSNKSDDLFLEFVENGIVVGRNDINKGMLNGFNFTKELVEAATLIIKTFEIFNKLEFQPINILNLNQIINYKYEILEISHAINHSFEEKIIFKFNSDTIIEDNYPVIIPRIIEITTENKSFIFFIFYFGNVTMNTQEVDRKYICCTDSKIIGMKMVQNMSVEVFENMSKKFIDEAEKFEGRNVLLLR